MRKTSKALLVLLASAAMILSACGKEPASSTPAPDTSSEAPVSSSDEPSSSSEAPSSTSEAPAVVQTGIQILSQPSKKDYFIGDLFDSTGLLVGKVMSDGNVVLLSSSEYTVSAPDMMTAGEKDVVVTSGSFTASFKINVAAIEIVSLEITAQPAKTFYFVGDTFDPAGLVVTAIYNNGDRKVLTSEEYQLSAPNMAAEGEPEIEVSVGSIKAKFSIVVSAAQLIGLEVYAEPDAVEYERNQDFDSTGLIIAGLLDNGKKTDMTSKVELSEPDMSTAGVKTIFVSNGTFSTTFDIEVLAPRRVKPVIENYPDKTSYEIGETVSYAGLKVSYLLTDGSYEEIPDLYYSVSEAPSTASSGQFEIVVTFSSPIVIEAGEIANGESLGVAKAFNGGTYNNVKFFVGVIGPANYTYNTYTTVSPSNWNELTYQDANDTQIMSYISGNFFNFNFEFEEGHEGDTNYIVEGGYQVEYDGVEELTDITAQYAGVEGYNIPEGATSGYAYNLKLRNDLKWDDGTAIHAEDFVYTMKQQEDPEMWNYRADSFYNGETVIHNARNYLYQGQEGYFPSKSLMNGVYNSADDNKLIFKSFPSSSPYYKDAEDGTYAKGDNVYIIDWFLGSNPSWKANVENYGLTIIAYAYGGVSWTPAQCKAVSLALDGKTFAEIKADETLKSYWDAIIGWWQTEPGEELDFFVSYYQYPAMNFSEVGIKVGETPDDLIVILDTKLSLLKEDGTLSYRAAYNFSGLPLVHRAKYEANRVAPQIEGGLYTSTYNSSVESSASWGPYKLTYFQAGKQYVLEKNPNWYGWSMPKYQGQYMTDRIVCDTVAQWNTAWLMFQKGDLASIGIDVSVADDYKGSSRAVFTADDYVGSLQLQSDVEALAERSTSDKNKMILAYDEFRQAVSLAIDRDDYCAKCTTASLAGYGLFNSMHYFDVENGIVYRDTDEAKLAICAAYGIDVLDYDTLDDAYAAVSGYNLELAREKLVAAYEKALADQVMTPTDKIVLTVGSSADTEAVQRQFAYLKAAFEKLAETTVLEGRLTLELDTSFGTKWADSFRDGEYDICSGGWSGATWNPGYLLMAYLDPDYMYSQKWATNVETLVYNPFDDGDPEHELEMSLLDWWKCLNAVEGYPDWGPSSELAYVTPEFRLGIIAQLEQRIIEKGYTVPLYNFFSASLKSYKIEYGTNTYNTFMAYGGLRYMRYTYNDAAWADVKASFDYKN